MRRLSKKGILLAAVGTCLLTTLACSPELLKAVGDSMRETGRAYQTNKIMLFGGSGHKTYLGCLSCYGTSSESLFNEYGSFGSAYSSTSIFNNYSVFGSQYSMYSACNPYASDPPVVVDGNGIYYGRLTVNKYRSDRYGNENLQIWLETVVCSSS